MLNSEEEEEEEMLKKIYEISECLWKINNLKVLIVYQVVDQTKLSFRWTKTKVWLSLLTFNAILFFLLFIQIQGMHWSRDSNCTWGKPQAISTALQLVDWIPLWELLCAWPEMQSDRWRNS